ncbi:MAG TPA: hypothetical protein VHR66_02870 [Gemmataceae bacterium]|jgi:Na+-transporting methylmalonyl-CoA/oxaloacetate decarboxylase gamma subunit|nr:hypothetical protein [Gemmataceae bacterium]
MGVVFLSIAALLIVVIYFVSQKRRGDATWERYRERHRKRQERVVKDEPIDPNFQFDQKE